MSLPKIRLSVVICAVFAVSSASAWGVVYVAADATGANNGTSWADAYTDLQTALANTSAGDIWVKAGTYKPGTTRTNSFVMKNNVALYGGFAGAENPATFDLANRDLVANETILSGDIGTIGDNSDNCYHVFYHPDGTNLDSTAILDGFTISGGNADDGNYPHGYGGGMYNYGNSPKLTNCMFIANLASSYGGGMCNWSSSNPTLINCTFNGNSGGIGGGGMFNYSSSNPTLANCTFSGNSAQSGGGMFNWSSSSPTLTHCTFTVNSASGGSGMYNYYNSNPTLTNCILWGNSGVQMCEDLSSAAVSYSCIQGSWEGYGNVNADPLFVRNPDPGLDGSWGTADDDYGDLHLQNGSPCINAGDPNGDYTGQTDMDDEVRVQQCRVDIGVDETPYIGLDCNSNGTADACEASLDSDGVPDECDVCPNTVPGSPVDQNGCPPMIPGDYDHDGDVDVSDLADFEWCASGPAIPYTGDCSKADFDNDNDVDVSDFGVFQRCLSGEDNPAHPDCVD